MRILVAKFPKTNEIGNKIKRKLKTLKKNFFLLKNLNAFIKFININ